jgi:hypothetical protein
VSRIALGGSAVLATVMGVVGAVTAFEAGAFTIGTAVIVAVLGLVAIHAVLHPESYRHPRFGGPFYRLWGIAVPLLAVAALVTTAFAPDVAAHLAYWSGFASVALLAGKVVDHRTARTTLSGR